MALAGTALGGVQFFQPVDVNLSSGYARGAMGDARNGPDSVQFIGCYNVGMVGLSIVACEAQTATGVYKSCSTTDANMVASARSISVGSYIFFRWDASGACTNVQVTNYSTMRPAVP
jgi:hypothetical protein